MLERYSAEMMREVTDEFEKACSRAKVAVGLYRAA
jgi:hypothetical protein